MRKNTIFTGVSCAIATPFLDNREIDYESFSNMIKYQLQNGCKALTVCGTTGEAATLDSYEHFKLIKFASKQVGGRIPVIAGNGSNCTSHAIELTKAAEEAGCDALLTVTPYYNKSNSDGLIRSFSDIADAASVPMIVYNVPSRTGVDIPLSVYRELAKHERIVGVKEASGNIKACMSLIGELSDKLDIYCGNDDILFPMLALGCKGCISVLSNILPRETQSICDLYFSGKISESRELQFSLSRLIDALFCDVNPIPLKYALSQMGLCKGNLRLPLYETEKKKKELINNTLIEYGLI